MSIIPSLNCVGYISQGFVPLISSLKLVVNSRLIEIFMTIFLLSTKSQRTCEESKKGNKCWIGLRQDRAPNCFYYYVCSCFSLLRIFFIDSIRPNPLASIWSVERHPQQVKAVLCLPSSPYIFFTQPTFDLL